jgi:hypothetical protein
MSARHVPYSQGSVQKKRDSPLPSIIRIEALKNATVVASLFNESDAQEQAGSVR